MPPFFLIFEAHVACQIAFAFLKFLIFMKYEATNTTHVRCSDYSSEAYRTNNYATLALIAIAKRTSFVEFAERCFVEHGSAGGFAGPPSS